MVEAGTGNAVVDGVAKSDGRRVMPGVIVEAGTEATELGAGNSETDACKGARCCPGNP